MPFSSQSDADTAVKSEFDDEAGGGDSGTTENQTTVVKPKAPRVKKDKKEAGA